MARDNRFFLQLVGAARALIGSPPTPVPEPMPLLAAPLTPTESPPCPPAATGLRTAPVVLTRGGEPILRKAPRASWWRRFWAFGVVDQIDVSRRRKAWHARYPAATWKQCQEASKLAQRVDHGDLFESASAALTLEDVEAKMGPAASYAKHLFPPPPAAHPQEGGRVPLPIHMAPPNDWISK